MWPIIKVLCIILIYDIREIDVGQKVFFSFDCVKNDYDSQRTLRIILIVLILYVMPTHGENAIECSKN